MCISPRKKGQKKKERKNYYMKKGPAVSFCIQKISFYSDPSGRF